MLGCIHALKDWFPPVRHWIQQSEIDLWILRWTERAHRSCSLTDKVPIFSWSKSAVQCWILLSSPRERRLDQLSNRSRRYCCLCLSVQLLFNSENPKFQSYPIYALPGREKSLCSDNISKNKLNRRLPKTNLSAHLQSFIRLCRTNKHQPRIPAKENKLAVEVPIGHTTREEKEKTITERDRERAIRQNLRRIHLEHIAHLLFTVLASGRRQRRWRIRRGGGGSSSRGGGGGSVLLSS